MGDTTLIPGPTRGLSESAILTVLVKFVLEVAIGRNAIFFRFLGEK